MQELFPVNKRDQDAFVAHFKKIGLGPIADFQVIYEIGLKVFIFGIKFLLIFSHLLFPDIITLFFGFFLVRKLREIIK